MRGHCRFGLQRLTAAPCYHSNVSHAAALRCTVTTRHTALPDALQPYVRAFSDTWFDGYARSILYIIFFFWFRASRSYAPGTAPHKQQHRADAGLHFYTFATSTVFSRTDIY